MGTSFDSTLEVLKGLNKFCDNRKNTKMGNISHAIHIGIIQCKRHEGGQHGSVQKYYQKNKHIVTPAGVD